MAAHQHWQQALAAADKLRERFREGSVGLAGGLRGVFGERAHENPASLPGKRPKKKENAG